MFATRLLAFLAGCDWNAPKRTDWFAGSQILRSKILPGSFLLFESSSLVSQSKVIPVLGVIGGIGSGKSSVARRLQSLRPIAVIDADQCGHQVLHLPNVQERILKRFGPTVFETVPRSHAPRGNASTDALRPDSPQVSSNVTTGCDAERQNSRSHAERGIEGTANPQISRAALGRVVFGSDVAAETARRDLEAIVHPEIRSLLEREIRELRRQANIEAIVLDAAVLLEAGWNDLCDVVVFIDTPQADRVARVQAGRGWSAAELAKREASQWPLPRKRAAADAVLDNAGAVDDAAEKLNQIIRQRFATNDE